MDWSDQSIRQRNAHVLDFRFRKLSLEDRFRTIYQEAMWGEAQGTDTVSDRFFSGCGSHEGGAVEPYVAAVRRFLRSQSEPIDLIDVGCGDFEVGKRFVDLTNHYLAVDIVPELIQQNKIRFQNMNVEFRVGNAVSDSLQIRPRSILVFRQIFQHLCNADILGILGNLGKARCLLVTEMLPSGNFEPNLDAPSGRYSRSGRGINSGVVLTEPPFNLHAVKVSEICRVVSGSGIISTTVYTRLN